MARVSVGPNGGVSLACLRVAKILVPEETTCKSRGVGADQGGGVLRYPGGQILVYETPLNATE